VAEVGRQDWNLTLDIEPSAVGIGEGVDGEAVALMPNSA